MARRTDGRGISVFHPYAPGAVEIENNTDWNFKDLEEMPGSAKALKRNNRERNGILIGPSMAPRVFESVKFRRGGLFHPLP